ncbi:hypothetical protein H8356DRAFT_1698707 [Neocallimastix lanati (nom. inval.)]|nr:hypothetical protein H8356DRAFT_1698707 [Neocallimastix sp. JGI-2020a]
MNFSESGAQNAYLIGIGIPNRDTENISDLKKCVKNFILKKGIDGLRDVATIDPIDLNNGFANITQNAGNNKFWIYHIIKNNGESISEPFMFISYKRFLKNI